MYDQVMWDMLYMALFALFCGIQITSCWHSIMVTWISLLYFWYLVAVLLCCYVLVENSFFDLLILLQLLLWQMKLLLLLILKKWKFFRGMTLFALLFLNCTFSYFLLGFFCQLLLFNARVRQCSFLFVIFIWYSHSSFATLTA